MNDKLHLTVLEARRDFGNLVLDALAGKTTIVTRYGKPAAAIVPVSEAGQSRTVDLPSGASLTLSFTGPVLGLDSADRQWLFDLIDMFKKHEDALDTADADAAMAEPSESIPLDQLQAELSNKEGNN